tara:strand:+ start:2722 stop:3681 length:960 start_codon:yes stop_codon:yes gene_type:complete
LNIENYTYLLAHPQKISEEDLASLALLLDKYPYFQSARALQLKGLKNQQSYLYNDALKKTAAYTTDRDILFEYITSEKFAQNQISEAIIQHDASTEEIEVISENVSEQISLEIDSKIKEELKKAEAILNPELFQRKQTAIQDLVQFPSEEKSSKDSTTPKTVSEENISPKEQLGIDKPLEFTKNDTHSFSEWLKLTKAKPIDRAGEEASDQVDKDVKDIKVRKFELIDKFIEENPRLKPTDIANKNQDEKLAQKDLSEPFTVASDSLMTETLAKVYLQQKNYKKAIQAYKILILKNPEKSGFFADQIRAIKKLTNTEEQ